VYGWTVDKNVEPSGNTRISVTKFIYKNKPSIKAARRISIIFIHHKHGSSKHNKYN